MTLSLTTNTYVYEYGILCFSDYNNDGEYQSFTLDDAGNVTDAFCANNGVLALENRLATSKKAGTIATSYSWAEDQSRCGSEQDLDLSSIGYTNAGDLALL